MQAVQTYLPFPAEIIGPGKIYRSPMPTVAELRSIQKTLDVTTIVQLCFDSEFEEYEHADTLEQYNKKQFTVIKFPIEDFKVPVSKRQTRELVAEILEKTRAGENVLIHCVGGKGRTGLIVACIARKVFNWGEREAVEWVRKYVPGAVESFTQEDFIATCFEEEPGFRCEEAGEDLPYLYAPSAGALATEPLWTAASLGLNYYGSDSSRDPLFREGERSSESSKDAESTLTDTGSPHSDSGSGSEASAYL